MRKANRLNSRLKKTNREAILKKKTGIKTRRAHSQKNASGNSGRKKTEELNSIILRLENEIEEREKIQESLASSEERYRIISQVSSDFSFSVNINENGIRELDWISPGFEEVMKYSFEELVHPVNWQKHIHFDDHLLQQHIFEQINQGKGGKYEIRTFKGEGEICWLRINFYPVFDHGKNRTTKYYGAIRDITENKKIDLELQQINSELELRIQERTTQIETAVKNLQNEISQRIAIEDKLRKSEERYRKLVEFSPEAIFVHRDGKILFANNATLKLFGVSSTADLYGKNIMDYIHQDSKKIAITQYENVMNGSETATIMEIKGIQSNSELIFTEISSTLVEYKGEKAVQVVARDITERKIAEAALRESQERYKLVVEYSPFAIVIHQNGKIIYVNPETLKLIGANTQDEIVGKDIFSFVHQDFRVLAAERLRISAATGKPAPPIEERLIRLDGTFINTEILTVPFMLGNTLAFQSTFHDITKMKAANEQLRKLSRAVEQSSAAILITDRNGYIEYANPKFMEMTGFDIKETLGQNPQILKSDKQPEEFYSEMWKTILAGNEWRGELINKRKSGELYWEFLSISPIKNDKGEVTHFLAVKEDITERKKIEAELIKSKEEAEEANKIKSSLLANMSHEFRTPLNGILGFTQLLKEEVNDDEQKMMIDKIYRSGKRLMNTLNAILSLTEMENGDYIISRSEIDLTFFCRQIKSLYEPQAKEKSLSFDLNLGKEKFLVSTDETLLTKISSHIIDNAIKYTISGGVKLSLRKIKQFSGNEVAVLDIEDTGIGIRKEEQKIIFREFRQLSEGFRRDFEGLGLGLTLANKMAKLINANIRVKSDYGKGSIFSILLPLNKSEQSKLNGKAEQMYETLPPGSESNLKKQITNGISVEEPYSASSPQPYSGKRGGIHTSLPPAFAETKRRLNEAWSAEAEHEGRLNILLIEDNPLNIEVVERFLASVAKVTYARDGDSALQKVASQNFDILLIDINLGHGMNGVEVLEHIRRLDRYKSIPAVALTGYASAANKRDFLLKGFTNYLPKPFDKRALLNLIKQISS